MRRGRVWTAAAGAVVMGAVLAGCGVPPWETMGTGGGGGDAGPSRSASSTPTAAPTPMPNDLSSGTTERSLQAGPVSASVDYYSTLPIDQWTAAVVKPLAVSLTTTVTPDDGKKVYLQRATMIATPRNDTETLDPLASQIDTASASPGYPVLSPYTYSQTFNVGPLPDDAVSVTLDLTYEFLVQTTPTSTEYTKQSTSDRIVVAIADAPRS